MNPIRRTRAAPAPQTPARPASTTARPRAASSARTRAEGSCGETRADPIETRAPRTSNLRQKGALEERRNLRRADLPVDVRRTAGLVDTAPRGEVGRPPENRQRRVGPASSADDGDAQGPGRGGDGLRRLGAPHLPRVPSLQPAHRGEARERVGRRSRRGATLEAGLGGRSPRLQARRTAASDQRADEEGQAAGGPLSGGEELRAAQLEPASSPSARRPGDPGAPTSRGAQTPRGGA
jgi:hypothetical protein